MGLQEKINSLPSLKMVVEGYGLAAKKSLGQNFLLDRNITDKIIRMSLEKQGKSSFEGENVFEIGPGPGGLTRSILLNNPKSLTVVDKDERCIKIMNDMQDKIGDVLTVIEGDALEQNFANMKDEPRHIVSNLPYNISVPLLINWLKDIKSYKSLTLMFQKEVADRILSDIKSKSYGRISILSQLQCKIDRLIDLNPNNFTPPPKVWSTVLLFRPREETLTKEQIQKIEKLSQTAFSQRRKMIKQSLKSIEGIEHILDNLGIEKTVRAEEISPKQFLELANSI